MVAGLGYASAILGIGEESTYGTAVAVTNFVELNSDGLAVSEERLHSNAIPSVWADDDEVCNSSISVSGDLSIEMRYEGMELLLKHGLGSVTSSEVATFVVDATNNKLNFDIGGGELTATIPSGTYAMGTSQAVTGSLCKAIYDAIVAVEGTGVYTVTFSTTTKKVTITKSTGTFSILWKTGTNGADGTDTHIGTLIGFSDGSDSTGSLTYTANSSVVSVYDHTFTLADNLPTGLTLEIDRDISAFVYNGCKINTLGMSIDTGGFLMLNLGIIGQNETTGTATTPTLPTKSLVCFVSGSVTYNSQTINVKSANFTLNNALGSDRRFIGSRVIGEPQRTAKREVTGTFTIEFEDLNAYNDFRNATSRALTLTFTGTEIKTGFNYTITINFPLIKLTGNTPKISDAGIINMELPFKAYALDSTQYEMNVVLRNTLHSI